MERMPYKRFSSKLILFALVIVLFLPSCSFPEAAPVIPTAAIMPTKNSPTLAPQPQLPTIEILPDLVAEIMLGEPAKIDFLAKSEVGISRVELTNTDDELLASLGSSGAPLDNLSFQNTLNWVPEKSGEYTLNLMAYDIQMQASDSVTLKIKVFQHPKIITSGFTALGAEDSFDFATGKKGNLSGGDLYIYRASATDYRAVANNIPQIGGQLLYDGGYAAVTTAKTYEASHILMDKQILERIVSAQKNDSSFTIFEVPLETYAIYLYKRHQAPGDYVLFNVAGFDSDSVTLEYVVFEIPE